jgi:hypothetical protein
MPEYYGYNAPEQVDFGKTIADVGNLFIAAEAKREAKRQGEQKLLDESRKKISEIEQNSNQSQRELVGSGANKARDYILELERLRKSGKINGAEYNRRMTNINDSWDSYAFITKNMNERVAENIARQQQGVASANEIYLAKIQSELLNTRNKDFMFDGEGNMYMIDKSDPSKPMGLKSGGNIENIVDNKVDVYGLVADGVKNFGTFSQETGANTETGARLQKQYEASKYDLVHSIVDKNNPRAVVSILMDNAGEDYDQYYNNAEKEQLLSAAVEREESLNGPMTPEKKSAFMANYEKNNMIQYVPDENGSYQPVVTDGMIKKAFDFVDQTVEMSVGRTKAEDEDRDRGGNPNNPDDKNGTPKVSTYEVDLAAKVIAAWPKDVNAIRKATNNKYYFRWETGGLAVYKEDPDEYDRKKKEYNKLSAAEKIYTDPPKEVAPIRKGLGTVEQLGDEFFGDTEQDRRKWKEAIKKARGGGVGTSQTPQAGAGDDIMQNQ